MSQQKMTEMSQWKKNSLQIHNYNKNNTMVLLNPERPATS